MTTYAHTAAVIDRLLDELSLTRENVHEVSIYPSSVHIRLDEPVPGIGFRELKLEDGAFMYSADVTREDLEIWVFVTMHREEPAA